MNTSLKTAVQAVIAEWEEHGFATDGQMKYLCKALADEQAQAVEPVAYLIDWPDEPELGHYFSESATESGRSTPLYTHPAPPPAGARDHIAGVSNMIGERAEFIKKLRDHGPIEKAGLYLDAADMLEADAEAYKQGRYDEQMAQGPSQAEWDAMEAQQVAVPAGYALAMAVLQSDLHFRLDHLERTECDALIAAGQSQQGAKP